ncbi:hypothetical protein OHA98_32590 [Streptomyces sp. NBC_00654]|uniref:hypothetical protein n=1 Tax=Streptomyces sp. NBC_00654 TaxID=2975799 RepID=UPI002259E1F1|nr:hypothetical protein [Streptomyces sp. NBC_00654]MCX4969412.1 hypothetical protein [Streptomyces sp. NBC_00654]
MPDYFDRLLARYAPAADSSGGSGGSGGSSGPDSSGGSGARVRVRPRLPGPFERAEALRQGPPEPDEPAALLPSALQPSRPALPLMTRPGRETHTERHTVVRTEQAPQPAGDGPPAPYPAPAPTPLLRPSAAPAPALRPGTAEGTRAARRGGPSAPDAPPTAPAVAAAPARPSAGFARTAVPTAPRGSDTAAARGALGSVGRRAPRPADRVVHVQIGRLEVSAAPTAGTNGSPGGRPAQPAGRPAPVLTLDDYLSRGGKRD